MAMRSTLKVGICLTTCVLASVATAAAADSPLRCYFPIFTSGPAEYVGLSLVNAGTSVNIVTVGWTSAEGSETRTGLVTLLPGTQRTAVLREFLLTPDDPKDGWIRIEAREPGLMAYLTSGTDWLLDGVEPVLEPAKVSLFEHVAVNTGFAELDHADTLVTLVNPGASAAGARAELIGLNGGAVGATELQIPPSGSQTVRISEAFGDVLPANGLGGRFFSGYLRVVSNSELAGWLSIEKPLSRRLLRGAALDSLDSASLAIAGHFAAGGEELYVSELNLVNVDPVSVQLELSALDDRGQRLGSVVSLTLGPGQGIREDVLNLFHVATPAVFPPPLVTGSIRIRAAGGGTFRLAGDMSISLEGNEAAMMYPVATAGSTDWILPFAVSGPEYFTGYAFANPNELLAVQTDVTVELFDENGRPAAPARSISLSPAARFSALIDREIPAGYLRVHASAPIFPVGSIGTSSLSLLAFLPAYPQ